MPGAPFWFGFLGSVTAASLFLPQVWKSYRTKETQALAWSGIILGMLNGLFWVIYGLLQGDPFIYVTNSIFFVGVFLLMMLKRKYG